MRIARVCAFAALLAFAAPAAAQSTRSQWGVTASFVPHWKVPSQAGPLFEVAPVDMDGSDFRIGIVRGRDLSGDWGISFVRKHVEDGSTIGGEFGEACGPNGCLPTGELYTYEDVTVTGVMFHKFMPFGTIGKRVQIGLTLGGGVARFEGDVEGEIYGVDFGNAGQVVAQQQLQSLPARDLVVIDVVPLADLQLSAAVIVAPGLKIRLSGGVSLPGYHVLSLTANYLFGGR